MQSIKKLSRFLLKKKIDSIIKNKFKFRNKILKKIEKKFNNNNNILIF